MLGRVLALDEQLRDSIAPILSLLDALPPNDPFRSLGSLLQQGRTRAALKQLLLRESQRQPLCVVLEDLHWIDAETQAALDFLVESLPVARVLPTLVTWGTADRASPGEDAYTLTSQIPGAQLYEFVGRAHIPAVTATGEFCEVLRRFVRGETLPRSALPR